MACAESLSVDLSPACSALKKAAGFANFGYIFTVDDISAVGLSTGTITSFTFKSGKQLVKFQTKERTTTAESPVLSEGESNVALITHTVNLALYFDTQVELNAIQTILDADRLAVVLPTANKQFRVYGIATDSTLYDFANFGLQVTGGADAPGQNLNDPSRINLVLTGDVPNLPAFMLDTDYATTLALLEGYMTAAA